MRGKPVSTAARFRDGDAPSPTSVGDDACIVPPASRNHRPTGKAAHQKASLEGKLAPQATEGCIATSPNQYPNGETAAPSAADKPAPPESVKAAQGAAPLRHRQKAATPPLAGEASGGTAKPKHSRKGKAKADDTPPTPAEIIKAKRRRCADAEDIAGFLTKLVAIVVLLALLFGFAFGVTPMENDDMSPRISAGDLLLYYRLADDLVTGDVMVFEKDGEQYVGRIVANPGDTVEVTDQATLVVNGSTVLENDIYYTTPKYDNGPAYPLTLAQDEYFILCDYREGARGQPVFRPGQPGRDQGQSDHGGAAQRLVMPRCWDDRARPRGGRERPPYIPTRKRALCGKQIVTLAFCLCIKILQNQERKKRA